MEVIVRGKHFDVPDDVAERARRKLGRLEHYLPLLRDASVEVDVAHEKAKQPHRRYVVHVTVSAHGVHLQAEERGARLEATVDAVARVLGRQARSHKQRLYERGRSRDTRRVAVAPAVELEVDEAPLPDQVARVKRFAVKAMNPHEALAQMELLGHDFFLFHDADIGQFALLYRRRAGDFGLIIPELS